MQLTKKLATLGSSLFAATMIALPLSGGGGDRVAAATPISPIPVTSSASNSVVDVQTSYDCPTHVFQANITNKTDGSITPQVTFNTQQPNQPANPTIAPHTTLTYSYDYSGNNMNIATSVTTDGQQPLQIDPNVDCNEPVSFKVSQVGPSAVTGMLTNNSPFVAQVVMAQANNELPQVINVDPGQSTLAALPFNPFPGQNSVLVNIGTTSGFSSSYYVNLDMPTAPILPINKQ